MSFTVVVKQEALDDTIEAYEYYEEKQSGLGERFLDELLHCYRQIAQYPTSYGFIDEGSFKILRDISVDKFPYVVVFEIIDKDVVVYAVHNTYKHPGNKLKKYRIFSAQTAFTK
jgi:plasmid stabilization system protein ParE